ncbi:hypothetical protein [Halorhodospira sp. 9622]|uniref:hypothetical protein n=1 Tax=Halorhodospira sp. 9622 TaxID=2899136 RepID=UPI001EE91527|nr:hypothetical protein [Halorhodospira sp. 9622]MCG5538972.1 hypothetical protein [Halorhodospira sp. 9622]
MGDIEQIPAADEFGAPEIPFELRRESACLVALGVRPMALLGRCADADESVRIRLYHLLESARTQIYESEKVISFVLPVPGGVLDYGYARQPWVVEFYRWVEYHAPSRQADRARGLLFGYAPCAIQAHEDRNTGAYWDDA